MEKQKNRKTIKVLKKQVSQKNLAKNKQKKSLGLARQKITQLN